MAEAKTRLTEQLGELDILDEIDDEHAAKLLELYEVAGERRHEEILAAQDSALTIVPRLLRGPLRKILFG